MPLPSVSHAELIRRISSAHTAFNYSFDVSIFGQHALDHIISVTVEVLRKFRGYLDKSHLPLSHVPTCDELVKHIGATPFEAHALVQMIIRRQFCKKGAAFYAGNMPVSGTALPKEYKVCTSACPLYAYMLTSFITESLYH